jgi:hypothetical protein
MFVLCFGYVAVGKHRRLILDEILAGVALIVWIIVDRISDSMFGGAAPNLVGIWSIRGVLLVALLVAYAIARNVWHVERAQV